MKANVYIESYRQQDFTGMELTLLTTGKQHAGALRQLRRLFEARRPFNISFPGPNPKRKLPDFCYI
jgi:hypothetical protein